MKRKYALIRGVCRVCGGTGSQRWEVLDRHDGSMTTYTAFPAKPDQGTPCKRCQGTGREPEQRDYLKGLS